MNSYRSSGQALVLVLLSMAVVLTLVLFILARSVTDVSVSTREENAVRAFSAAEAGIEHALVVGTGIFSANIGDASFTSTVASFAEGERSFVYPLSLSSGDTATVWFVEHNADSTVVCSFEKPCFTGSRMRFCWGRPGTLSSTSTTPAVELSVFYLQTPNDLTTTMIGRTAIDPHSSRRTSQNSFSAPDAGTCSVGGETFQFQKTIDFADLGIPPGSYTAEGGLYFGRLRMLYNSDTNHKVAFDTDFAGNSNLPSQGILVDSSGTAGDSSRRVEVFQGWPEAPGVLDYAIYSSTGLSK